MYMDETGSDVMTSILYKTTGPPHFLNVITDFKVPN